MITFSLSLIFLKLLLYCFYLVKKFHEIMHKLIF